MDIDGVELDHHICRPDRLGFGQEYEREDEPLSLRILFYTTSIDRPGPLFRLRILVVPCMNKADAFPQLFIAGASC